MQTRHIIGFVSVGWCLTACGDANVLPRPVFANVVDTSTLYALSVTDLPTPSGFDMFRGVPVRPELGEVFDFVIDVEGGKLVLQPPEVIGVSLASGFVVPGDGFDAILEAPLDDYVSDSSLTLTANLVFVVRSRIDRQGGCGAFVSLPHYGKFHVVSLDAQVGTLTLEHLVNRNCGYRDLEPGLPLN